MLDREALHASPERAGAHRQAFAERALAHRLIRLSEDAGRSGFTRFEVALAIMRYGVKQLLVLGQDAEIIDDVLDEARGLAASVASQIDAD